MTGRLALRIRRPLRGVRAHAVPAEASAAPARVRWLLDLETRARAESEARAAEQRALEACAAALEQIPSIVVGQLADVASVASELGLALAREIVGDVVDRGLADPTPVILRCLEEATHGAHEVAVRVRVSPDDMALVSARFASASDLAESLRGAEFVADPALERGAVRVETDAGTTRYDPRDAIEMICAEVRKGIAP